MKRILLSPWRVGTPKRMARELGLELVPLHRLVTNLNPYKTDLLVNWGCSKPIQGKVRVLNSPAAVAVAANKLRTFRVLKDNGVPTPEFTNNAAEAKKWLASASVMCFHTLHGHSGEGLVLCKKGSEDVEPGCLLYSKYFPKKVESRVLLIRAGKTDWATMYMEKKRISRERYEQFGLEESPTTYIRTYDNGWIFARGVPTDPQAVKLAKDAMKSLKLDYGAVDVMTTGKQYVVGEVNTAPGLEGMAFTFFSGHLKNLIEET